MIDLHSHSTMSDGTDSPTRVVQLAAEAGVDALALTDHDTLDHFLRRSPRRASSACGSFPAARSPASSDGVRPGACTCSCSSSTTGPGPCRTKLGGLQRGRNERNVQILDALNANGVEVDARRSSRPRPVRARSDGPSLARILVRKGYVATIQEAFDVWLAKGAPAYFERPRLTPEEAIDLTHASGGVCAVAHPISLGLEGDALDEFVAELTAAGLDGLECEYAAYAPEERAPLHALAARHDLAPTGGSDYHGENKPGPRRRWSGRPPVPDEYLDELESRRR